MSQWFRVFGVSEVQPEPAAILEHLRGLGVEADGHFRGDDQGWFAADIGLVQGEAPLQLERFLSTEEGIRAELNTWAAWLETCDYSPNSQKLMEDVVATKQLFTLRRPIDYSNEILVEKACVGVCQFLAKQNTGVYQVDNKGLFAANWTMMLQEY